VKLIGEAIDRVDGRAKVTGTARYAAEVAVAGVAHGAIVASRIGRGVITGIDTSAAERAPGVIGVLTHERAMKVKAAGGPNDRAIQVLQDAVVHYARQPIALVVADSLERASHAAALVEVRYDAVPPEVELDAALDRAAWPRKPRPDVPAEFTMGNVAAGLARADVRVHATYTTPFQIHNPMEPHATTAVWQGDRLTVYDSTQGIFRVRDRLAGVFGLDKADVRVISTFVGGGFGSKGVPWSHVVLAALAARQLRRPVKLVLTRGQMFGPVGGRPRTVQTVALGATRAGTLTAIRHDSVSACCRFDEFVEHTTLPTRALYATPNLATTERIVELDIGPPANQRGPGEATGLFAIESAIDELAVALAIDPLELRLRNHADVEPSTGKPWSSKSLIACYRQAADAFGWGARDSRPGSQRDGQRRIGWGMASATYGAQISPASAVAQLRVDGTAVVRAGSQDIGTGTCTVMTQIAAESLGLALDKVAFELGDTAMPDAPSSTGSRTAASVGAAVRGAARRLRDQLFELARGDAASPVAGAAAADLVVDRGRIALATDPARGEPVEAVLRRAGKHQLEARFDHKPSAELERWASRAFGAVFTEVHVDLALATVRVSRVVAAFAAGTILNAKTARSQCLGGIVWGIGMALHEQAVFDPHHGRIMNADLAEYHVPVNADVPAIDVILIPEDDPRINELGIKGIGEIPICGVAAAIANAVYHATGKRLRDLPITAARLL
jgi:xanthine dehydrogenase YagR molybdenum-binding subunit